jgi:hypothetical protein
MSYKCALGNVPTKRKKNIKDPPIQLPDDIVLGDGRIFNVKQLIQSRSTPEIYNLRSPTPKKPANRPNNVKYSLEDRLWMAVAPIETIMERYAVTKTYASVLKNQSIKVKESQGL